jgi:hypothetical protein
MRILEQFFGGADEGIAVEKGDEDTSLDEG